MQTPKSLTRKEKIIILLQILLVVPLTCLLIFRYEYSNRVFWLIEVGLLIIIWGTLIVRFYRILQRR
ncbi:MAG: hypothetical protein LBE76_02415 [Nitrososphaerota archaeon]|nr:hypothetical protein [Nitrososphaerota archaeon]